MCNPVLAWQLKVLMELMHLDPAVLTPVAFDVLQTLFLLANQRRKSISFVHNSLTVLSPELYGLEYLWRVALEVCGRCPFFVCPFFVGFFCGVCSGPKAACV
jgi:hypothetical protein